MFVAYYAYFAPPLFRACRRLRRPLLAFSSAISCSNAYQLPFYLATHAQVETPYFTADSRRMMPYRMSPRRAAAAEGLRSAEAGAPSIDVYSHAHVTSDGDLLLKAWVERTFTTTSSRRSACCFIRFADGRR